MKRIVWPLPAAALLALAASAGGASAAGDAATAKSAADLGGMDELVAAAKKEGTAQRHRAAAGLGQLRRDHQGLRRRSTASRSTRAQPDAQQPGRDQRRQPAQGPGPRARRVRPRQATSRCANTDAVRALQGRDLGRHPATGSRTPSGAWVNDYGGYMSIGYDAAKVPAPTTVARPAQARVQGQGRAQRRPDPGRRGFNGVMMASLANGGSADDIAPGRRLLQASSRRPATSCRSTRPRPPSSRARPRSSSTGTTCNAAQTTRSRASSTGRSSCRQTPCSARYYVQAINKDAPHPAAARLWEEFLYSDEGQNLWLKGGARPVRADAMEKAGTIDKAALAALPAVDRARRSS